MVLGYLGVVIATKKGKEMVGMLVSSKGQAAKIRCSQRRRRKRGYLPKIFDTSVIIDGRIAEIMKTDSSKDLSLFPSLCW